MAKAPRANKKKRKKQVPKTVVLAPTRPYDPKIYRINSTGVHALVEGKRILDDTRADISKYEDRRIPKVAGKTIKKPFRAYGGRSSINTVKG